MPIKMLSFRKNKKGFGYFDLEQFRFNFLMRGL